MISQWKFSADIINIFVVGSLVCTGAIVDAIVEVLAVEIFIMSDMTAGLFIDILADMITGVGSDIDNSNFFCMLVDVDANVFAGTMAFFGLAKPGPSGKVRCGPSFDCWPIGVLDCVNVLQTWMPSYHV